MKSKKRKAPSKKSNKHSERGKKPLDSIPNSEAIPKKETRGRHRTIPWEWVTGRASNCEYQLKEIWAALETPLLVAKTEAEITGAFQEFAKPYTEEFVPRLSSDILSLLNDPAFPKRAMPRIKFLARSLAGRPSISLRTSRDICDEAARQEKLKSPHRILRREFYIECSCGYKGPALNNNCRKCGAQPQLALYEWTGEAPEIPSVEEKKRTPKQPDREIAQDVIVPTPPSPNHVRCHCGATVAAASHADALKALVDHKRLVHREIPDKEEADGMLKST